MSLSLSIAINLFSLWKRPLPEYVAQRARICVLDTFGVMLAGSTHEAAAILHSVVLPNASLGPATLIGSDLNLNVLDAAQLNGLASHLLDFDDSNSQLHGHPSVAVLPSLMAVADEFCASGEEFLRAYVCGVEVCGRIGMGVGRYQYTHGWHPTTTIGIFGGVAASALIQGLTYQQTATAFGIAASLASGIKSNFGTMTKPLIVGQTARNALMAVKLAQAGFTASLQAFEHHHGYLNVFNQDAVHYNTGHILENWGEPYVLEDMGIKQKRYPCCYACMPVLEGVEQLMHEHMVKAADIERIELKVHSIRFPHINVPNPIDGLAAKFSAHYCTARLLQTGQLTIEDFESKACFDPATLDLMKRTTLSIYGHENTNGAEVRLIQRNGRILECYMEQALGAEKNKPLPQALVKAKFDMNAARVIPRSQAGELYEAVLSIEKIPDIREISRLLRRPNISQMSFKVGVQP